MGFGKAFQQERMMEVWNKADLLLSPLPGLSISCLTGEGTAQLFAIIEHKLSEIKGQTLREVEYAL